MKPIPDFFSKLIGYRSWNAESQGLYGVGHRTLWTPGKRKHMTAACSQTQEFNCPSCGAQHVIHEAPQKGCGCGLYAFKDPVSYMRQIQYASLTSAGGWRRTQQDVHGVVRIWGRCIEHKNGYRAQFAEIALLCTLDEGLCKAYGAEQFRGTFFELVAELHLDEKTEKGE